MKILLRNYNHRNFYLVTPLITNITILHLQLLLAVPVHSRKKEEGDANDFYSKSTVSFI